MRRKHAISVRVKAPSRGVVSRLPGQSADLLPGRGTVSVQGSAIASGSTKRAASRASNVRYEQGVIHNAPGYTTLELITSTLAGLVASWPLDELSGTRKDSTSTHDLAMVPGIDSLDPDATVVSAEIGKFNNAALFNAPLYRAIVQDLLSSELGLDAGVYGMLVRYVSDLMSTTLGLDNTGFYSSTARWDFDLATLNLSFDPGFINPRPSSSQDSGIISLNLDGGTMTLVIVSSTTPQDSGIITLSLDSGNYLIVVVTAPGVTDSLTTTLSLDGTSYDLVVIVAPSSTDSATITLSADSGTYTQTVLYTATVSESATLTLGLSSGSYS